VKWFKEWWQRMGWRPDPRVAAAKDQRVEDARLGAIAARQEHERVTAEVLPKVSRAERLAQAYARSARAAGR
jgi:hypothetical protein